MADSGGGEEEGRRGEGGVRTLVSSAVWLEYPG